MQQDETYPAGQNGSAAQNIQTNPVKGGRRDSFGTHKLVEISPERIEFKPAIGYLLLYVIFIIAGIGVLLLAFKNLLYGKCYILSSSVITPGLIGLTFIIVGVCTLYLGTAPIVFDKNDGYFWKGRKSPKSGFNIDQIKTCVRLDNINGLQLISEYRTGTDSYYTNYEIDLVLDNGIRVNVVDHINLKLIRSDAEKLSAFLGKPLTDLTQR
jgi:hypothetical protein